MNKSILAGAGLFGAAFVSLFADSTSSVTSLPSSVTGAYNTLGSDGLRDSQRDAYFDLRIDLTPKSSGNPEIIWGTGSNSQGMSLLYLPGNKLGLYLDTRATGLTAPELYLEYELPDRLVNRTDDSGTSGINEGLIDLSWSIDLRDGGQAALSLWVDHEQVATATGSVANARWATGGAANARLGQGAPDNATPPHPNNIAGGVAYNYFAGATAFDALSSYASIDSTAGLRYWAGKQIVNTATVVDWEAVRAPQWLKTGASTPRYLVRDSSTNYVTFTATPPSTGNADAQWNLVPVAPGSEWFYLLNAGSGTCANFQTSDGRVLCSSGTGTTAQWRWAAPASDSADAQQLECRYATGGARYLTTRSATENPISNAYAYALTSSDVNAAWTEAWWLKHDYLPETLSVTGAVLPFATYQAEDATLLGAASVIDATAPGDRIDGFAPTSTSDTAGLKATAREALGRKAVLLGATSDAVEFTLDSQVGSGANVMTVRYSIPDDFLDGSNTPWSWTEHSLTLSVSKDGGATYVDLPVKQVMRYDAANLRMTSDSSYHKELWMNARHLWSYWRYAALVRGGCARIGDQPLDNPDSAEIDPDGLLTTAQMARNKTPLSNGNPDTSGAGSWLSPIATRRFTEMRALVDPEVGPLAEGDRIRITKTSGDTVAYAIIDAVEFENEATATMPTGYISITDSALTTPAVANDNTDDDSALNQAINLVKAGTYQGVWIPEGFFRMGNRIDLGYGSNVTIKGAGMAHTVLFGSRSGPEFPELTYDAGNPQSNPPGYQSQGFRHFGFRAPEGGVKFGLSDLTMLADGTDRENGGNCVAGAFGPGTLIQRVYFQYAAVPVQAGYYGWDARSPLPAVTYGQPHLRAQGIRVADCRVRDSSAGSIIVSSGAHNILIENCHVRGGGDDALALISKYTWSDAQTTRVKMVGCTAEANWRGDGFAYYGGYHNSLENVVVSDSNRAGIWLSPHFEALSFGDDEGQNTYLRDFVIARSGRADQVVSNPTMPSYIAGTEVFRGALRLSANIYQTITYDQPAGACGSQSGNVVSTTYRDANVSRILVQGGEITDSTNDAIYFAAGPYAFNDTWNTGAEPFALPEFKDTVLSNLAIDGIGTGATSYAVNANDTKDSRYDSSPAPGFQWLPKSYLNGKVFLTNLTFSNVASGHEYLAPPSSPANFTVADPSAPATVWTP